MQGDKRDERALLPTLDLYRLWADLGGNRALSARMTAAGFGDFWELKNTEQRRRSRNIRFERIAELLHVHRLQGRNIHIEDYIVWHPTASYPTPSSLPQPVPVSRRESAAI